MESEYKKHHEGVIVEQHDHDHNYGAGGMYPGYGGYPGYGAGGGFGLVWGVFAFIAFIVIIGWIWGQGRRNEEHHERLSDKHHESQRCIDKVGYEAGYTRKELNDMQAEITATLAGMVRWHEDELRFGQPYGNHTQCLPMSAPVFQHGCPPPRQRPLGVVNGSQISDTQTFAVDHSVI